MWAFKDVTWQQDDAGERFTIKSLFGKHVEVNPIAPLDLLLKARSHPDSDLCEGTHFPTQFQFCPACGVRLIEAIDDVSSPWVPPYGAPNGLKVVSKSIQTAPTLAASGESFELPLSNGLFAFASLRLGASSRLLLAIQRDNGLVWVYQPKSNPKWHALEGRLGEDTLPSWAWSVASNMSETGFVVPGKQGPAWVTVDWSTNKLVVDRGNGESIGGAARLKEYLLAPVMRNGKVTILIRREEAENWSDCEALSDPLETGDRLFKEAGRLAVFGTPVVDEVRQVVYWPARSGYVRVAYPDAQSNAKWLFRPWSSSAPFAVANIELGVPYLKTGARPGYWQLCEIVPPAQNLRDEVHYKIFKFDGDQAVDFEDVESGQFVTTGRAAFSWLYDHWNNVHDFNLNDGEQAELRYPILQFGEKGLVLVAKTGQWEGREDPGMFSDVFGNRNLRATAFTRLVLQNSGSPGVALTAADVDAKDGVQGSQFRIPVAQLPEIAAFIHQSDLYVYFPTNGACYRWPLKTITE